jgi:hypothetical protein
MRKVIVLVILLAVVFGGWYVYKEYNRKNKDLADVVAAITTDATTLTSAFEKDPLSADKTYLGKIIAVNGTIKSVEKEDGATVILGAAGSTSSVRCSIDTMHIAEVINLQEGQQTTIKGECTGFRADETGLSLGSDVILNRCVIVPYKK